MQTLDECAVLSDAVPSAMPVRSTLYRLLPISMETAERESLSSYFCRLADAHCISPFQLADMADLSIMGHSKSRWSRRAWQDPQFNGAGEVPRIWTALLEGMTSVQSLDRLTVLQLHDVVGPVGLIAKEKRWCPICLDEDSQHGLPYGRLLWEIAVVTACPSHAVKLVKECSCSPEQRHTRMQAKYLHHICKFCGGDLSACSPPVKAADDREKIVAQLISRFLESAYFNVPVQRSSFSKSLATLIDHNFDGKAAWLVQALGVSKVTVGEWLHEVRPPSLARVVQIAQAAQCPVVDLFAGDTRGLSMHSSRAPRRSNNKRLRTKVDKRHVQDELQKYLAESEPISAAEASRRLGVSQRYLYLWFNSVTKELASRRYVFLAERAKAAVREREVRYRTTAQSLLANGSTLSWARFRAVLGKDANPFTPELRTLWKRVCTEEENKAEFDSNRCK